MTTSTATPRPTSGVTAQPTIGDLEAWAIQVLLTPGCSLNGLALDTLTEPYATIAQLLDATDPVDRLSVLQQEVRSRNLPAAISLAIGNANPNQPTPAPTRTRYVIHYAAEALQTPEAIDWVIEELLAVGSVGVFFGAPGSMKTWSCLHLAVCLSTDMDWLNHEVQPGAVLIVDEESGHRRMNRRLGAIMRGLNAPATIPLSYITLAGFNLANEADQKALLEAVDKETPRLIVIDALVDIIGGGDENKVESVQPVLQFLRMIAETRACAILLIHHSTKVGNTYRGSSAIAGAVDLLLLCEKIAGGTTIHLSVAKNRDGEPTSFDAVGTWTNANDPALATFRMAPTVSGSQSARYSNAQQYVIDYLTQHGASLLTDIQNHASSCSSAAARTATYRLTRQNIVRRCDSGGPGTSATYDLVSNMAPIDLAMWT